MARKLSFMILRNEFSTYFHACLSVRVVQIHVLLEIELSKEKITDDRYVHCAGIAHLVFLVI